MKIFSITHVALRIGVCACVAVILGCQPPTFENLLTRATALQAKGQHAEAIIEVKNALQKQPDSGEARFALGRSLLVVGDFRSAEEELRRAMASGWPKEQVIPPLARCLLMQERYQELLYEFSADAVPESAELHAVRGLAQLALGRVDQAGSLFDDVLKRAPENADALLGLARIALKNKDAEGARALIDRAIAAAPESLDAWLLKGELHLELRQLEPATTAYEKALNLYPDNVAALLNLAAIRAGEGQSQIAVTYATRAAKIAPANPRAHFLLALAAYRANDAGSAVNSIDAALKLSPANPSYQLLSGTILVWRGSWEDALTPLRRVLEKTPVDVPARKLYGAAMSRTGRTAGALSVLIPMLQLAPDDPTLLAIIGDAYLRQGDLEKAAAHLEKAVAAKPDQAFEHSAIGLEGFVAFDRDRTLDDTQRALLATRDYAEPMRLLALARLQQGKYEQALASIGSLGKAASADPVMLTLKGTALLGKKDPAGARLALEAAQAADSSYAPAAVQLARLDAVEGFPEKARERMDSFLAQHPRNVEGLVGAAVIGPMFGAKDSEITGWLERARAESPSDARVLMMLVQAYRKTKEDAKIPVIIAGLAKYAGDRADVQWVLGVVQLETGDAAAAMHTFSKLLAARPDSPEVMRLLAESELRASNYVSVAHARILLTKALVLRPNFFEALITLAELELRGNRLPEALQPLREAQRANPAAVQPYVMEGDILMLQGQIGKAEAAYAKAFALQPAGATTIRLHGTLQKLGRAAEAESLLRKWLEEQPADVPVRAYYGNYLLQQRKYAEAAREYERLLGDNPDYSVVLNNYAWVLYQLNDPRAEGVARRASSANPNDPAALDTLGVILIKRGELVEGIAALQRALSLSPDSNEARYHLAEAWLKAGNKAKAVREFEQIARASKPPQREQAQKLLKELSR